MQLLTTGAPVAKFSFGSFVRRLYEKWEEEKYSRATIRGGIATLEVKKVCVLGMEAATTTTVRDWAMVVLDYCVNGLLESCLCSIETSYVIRNDTSITAPFSGVKRRSVFSEPLVRFQSNLSFLNLSCGSVPSFGTHSSPVLSLHCICKQKAQMKPLIAHLWFWTGSERPLVAITGARNDYFTHASHRISRGATVSQHSV